MKEEHKISSDVRAAQQDMRLADELIHQYQPFIKSETAKFLKRPVTEGLDDEYGIAMFAFYEAMMSYRSGKGSFLKLAAISIRNRMIDFYRQEKRHMGIIHYEQEVDSWEKGTMLDNLKDDRDEIGDLDNRLASQSEIEEYSRQLATFGISLSDVADNCPKQERTMRVCMSVLAYARENSSLLEELVRTKKLPMADLVEGSGAERKTLERHRQYIVAILLAYTNGYEIIRGHLYQLSAKEVDKV